MSRKTMIKIRAGESCIDMKTISFAPRYWSPNHDLQSTIQSRKPRYPFCFPRRVFEHLKVDGDCHVERDINSFAELRLYNGVLSISFTWLSSKGCSEVKGYTEDVHLNYGEFSDFLKNSLDGGQSEQKYLSQEPICEKPKLDFSNASQRLQEILTDPHIKRRFVCALRDNFNWPYAKTIHFFPDYLPYSFFFREEKADGSQGICGGLIYHQYDTETYYGVHT